MARRSTPLVLLIWLVVLTVAGGIWALLAGDVPEDDAPPPPEPPAETGAADDAPPEPESAVWTLKGRVRDSRGVGVAGARVDVAGQRVESDGAGRFEVPDLPWTEHDVVIWKEGHAVVTRHVRPGDAVDVRLRPMLAITGVVQLPDGTPLAGHPVHLRNHDDSLRDAVTDDVGAFAFDNVVAGQYWVRGEAHVSAHGAFLSRTVRATAGATAPVVVELPAAEAFRGHVTAPDGSDVEGALVYATYYRNGGTRNGERTTTDAQGRFALVVPLDQACSVIVETPTPEDGWRFKRWFRHKLLPADGPLDVRLEEGHVIAGEVLGDRGIDVAGRRIWAYRVVGNQRKLVNEGRVKGDGTFRVGGLWDAEYELRIGGAAGAFDDLVLTPSGNIPCDSTDVVLRLHRARPLGGRLLDAERAPCKSTMVYAFQRDVGFRDTARTDGTGRFSFPRVPPGTLHLTARPGGRIGEVIDCGTWRAGDTNVEICLEE